jgi:hypothetical protein
MFYEIIIILIGKQSHPKNTTAYNCDYHKDEFCSWENVTLEI